MSSSRDNWVRLVEAVVKREQIWQLCHQHSISTISSDDSSGRFLSFSSNNLETISVYPETGPSVSQVGSNASSAPVTWKLFSAWYGTKKSKERQLDDDIPKEVAIHGIRRFSLHEIQAATKDFSKENILPGAWDVYRGLLADGSRVAVKCYRDMNVQSAEIRFRRELEINNVAAAHPNVLQVLGFCYAAQHRLLVFPFMANGSVAACLRERHKLHPPQHRRTRKGRLKSQPPLNWATRKQIAMGVAKGLVHLHKECGKKILHRDIKAANILLNEDFEAAVAYMELGVVVEHNVAEFEATVRGSYGFIAPDYLLAGKCSEKNDVFGYGTFLLELITGLRAFDVALLANDEDFMLLDWVKGKYRERQWEVIVDANAGTMMKDLVEQLMQIALICTSNLPENRPKMSEVVAMLENGHGSAEWYKKEETRELRTPEDF